MVTEKIEVLSLNIRFRRELTIHEEAQVREELYERLRDFETVLKDLFEDDFDCMFISITRREPHLEEVDAW